MHRANRALLPAIVFITGGCVLVVEVVAIRVLSPHFGNTLFTVSSVLSVVLAGLSLGYYLGGRLTDARPHFHWFFSLIFVSGASVIVLHTIGQQALSAYGSVVSLHYGPLLFSGLLFFIPAVLLGTLSPYAIALQKKVSPESGVGSVAGAMFFWSTVGSIAGSLAAGFVLVPHVGVFHVIIGCGIVLSLLGLCALATLSTRGRVTLVMVAGAVLALAVSQLRAAPLEGSELYRSDGVYERLTIFDDEYAGRPARFFVQDRSVSGAMFLDSDELVFDYTKYVTLYMPFVPRLERALVIGGGAYSVPKALLGQSPTVHVDVAEIEPSLFDLARRFFRVPDSPRLANYVTDGRRLLSERAATYDLIFSDVYYSLYPIPPHFTTREFFAQARTRLNPNGVMILNLIGSLSAEEPSFALSEIRTFREVFPEVYVFATRSPDTPDLQNIILVGVNRDGGGEPDWSASDNVFVRESVSRRVPLERYNLSAFPLLTDDYAPVEYMVGALLSRERTGSQHVPDTNMWSGERALRDIAAQLTFGSRARGTAGHAQTIDYITKELSKTDAAIMLQKGAYTVAGEAHPITNIIARFDPENPSRMILATHYDTLVRAYADTKDPNSLMPGANNGASGVAVLLETARALSAIGERPHGIDIVFFDGEEGVGALGAGEKKWIPLGSSYFASQLQNLYPHGRPRSAVVVDMVCDRDLTLYQEASSLKAAPKEVEKIWSIGSTRFPSSFRYGGPRRFIGDDHMPLIAAGVPSVLLIDFDYHPWFNTSHDTLDKCSPQSLEAVGKSLLQFVFIPS